MPVYSPPPVEPVKASLTFGDRAVDLASRALVVTVVPSPRWARESEVISGVHAAADSGADIVEVPADPRLLGPAAQLGVLPVAARVTTTSAARAALTAGAGLLLVPAENLDLVMSSDVQNVDDDPAADRHQESLAGRLAVMVRAISDIPERRAGQLPSAEGELPVAFDTLHLTDVDLVAEATLAISLGARLVRTHDIRKVRRVVEVIASLLEARQ